MSVVALVILLEVTYLPDRNREQISSKKEDLGQG